mmetsp:Transcript_35078/g.57348  ORF Transcript_35078/g.57348 Transcript_35078/m.57348 type:complete len:100 (+) Transcript_35078:841-1140(+)
MPLLPNLRKPPQQRWMVRNPKRWGRRLGSCNTRPKQRVLPESLDRCQVRNGMTTENSLQVIIMWVIIIMATGNAIFTIFMICTFLARHRKPSTSAVVRP